MTLYSVLKARLLKGKVVILGIGDVKMHDDGVGPYVINALHEILPPSETFKLVNGGTVAELYREEIVAFRPAHLLIVDAIDFHAEPGALTIMEREEMKKRLPNSSHLLPMSLTIDWITNELPEIDVFLLAIQPVTVVKVEENLELAGEGEAFFDAVEADPLKPFFRFTLTPRIEITVKNVVQVLVKILQALK